MRNDRQTTPLPETADEMHRWAIVLAGEEGMSAKHPEPTDYPSWMAHLLFDPEEVYRRTYCGNSVENLKTLHRILSCGRGNESGLLADTCIQTELNRIELIRSGAALAELRSENAMLRRQIEYLETRIGNLADEVSKCKKKKEHSP